MSQQEKSPPSKKKPANYYRFMKYGGMAFQMGVTIFLFVFLGRKLDNYFQLSPPYLTAALSVVGVFLAMFLVIRQLMADQKQ